MSVISLINILIKRDGKAVIYTNILIGSNLIRKETHVIDDIEKFVDLKDSFKKNLSKIVLANNCYIGRVTFFLDKEGYLDEETITIITKRSKF